MHYAVKSGFQSSGLLKVDREIIDQQSKNNRTLEIKKLIGISEALKDLSTPESKRGHSVSVSYPVRELKGKKTRLNTIEKKSIESPTPDNER